MPYLLLDDRRRPIALLRRHGAAVTLEACTEIWRPALEGFLSERGTSDDAQGGLPVELRVRDRLGTYRLGSHQPPLTGGGPLD